MCIYISQFFYIIDNFSTKTHYVKGIAKAGQVYRLLAVFQDGGQDGKNSVNCKDPLNSTGREKERGRYAQLLSENRQVSIKCLNHYYLLVTPTYSLQILYVSLTAKGKFYEIDQHIPQLLQKCNSLSKSVTKTINTDCVHRINHILQTYTEFPINLKFIAGPQGNGTNITGTSENAQMHLQHVNNIFSISFTVSEYLTVYNITTENSVIACPIDESENFSPLHLRKIYITPNINLMKCLLGFENEQRMFSNPNVQNVLKFCQFNCDNFSRSIEYEVVQRESTINVANTCNGANIAATTNAAATTATSTTVSASHNNSNISNKTESGLKILSFSKLFGSNSDNNKNGHEKEDSIIFLSKNELEHLESKQLANANGHSTINSLTDDQTKVTEKMKVFQSNSKKSNNWFKNLRSNHGSSKVDSMNNLNLDQDKFSNIERYQDMSKLIQERFGNISIMNEDSSPGDNTGGALAIKPKKNERKTFTSSSDSKDKKTEMMQKSLSLQNFDSGYKNEMAKPDLVNINFRNRRSDSNEDVYMNTINDDLDDEDDDDADTEDVEHMHLQSFVTQKLYNEFHVKTRQYSKSSSSLHQILNFAVPQKAPKSETNSSSKINNKKQFYQEQKKKRAIVLLKSTGEIKLDSSVDFDDITEHDVEPYLSILDDLPYSSVRDSIIGEQKDNQQDDNLSLLHADLPQHQSPTESIYAEICSLPDNNSQQINHFVSSQPIKNSIKISINNDDNDVSQYNGATNINVNSEIYHTIE